MRSSRGAVPTSVELSDVACSAGPLTGGMTAEEATDLARVLKALADPARLRLLSLIADSPALAACVCDLTEPLGLSQPTVSHHLKVLVGAGLLEREQRGAWAWYSLVPGALAETTAHLPGLVRPTPA